jgi:hypothetical protein
MATGGDPAIPEAHLAPSGQVRRVDPAGARSINETGEPTRQGATPQDRAASLGRIVEFLAPGDPTHKRYLKRDGMTFCNIYLHDYCHLAGVYLPRVWWNDAALASIRNGQSVTPKLGATVHEVVVNELVGWLGKFAPGFGWRRGTSLTDLQDAANAGSVAIIAAQHRLASHHGHIVAVVPETPTHHALRGGTDVTTPLQSQAGSDNFDYGTPLAHFWTSSEHINPQFWIHD